MNDLATMDGGGEIQVLPPSQAYTMAKVEIDTQIATAKHYRRSVRTFLDTAKTMACLDEETAASCFYSLPRGGKTIEGPSARIAEIAACAWTNLRHGARIVDVGEKFITALGFAHDLETNNYIEFSVQRRITDKSGKRFNDDMIVVTGNAACAIALRNAVLKVIPKAFWNQVYLEARKTAIGDVKTLGARRQQAVDYFAKMGVTADRVLAVLGKKGIEDVDLEDLAILTGLKTAIKDGDTTIEEAFPVAGAADKIKELLASRGGNGAAPHEAKPEAPPEPPADEETRLRLQDEFARAGLGQKEVAAKLKAHGVRTLDRITQAKADAILAELKQLPDAREPGQEG